MLWYCGRCQCCRGQTNLRSDCGSGVWAEWHQCSTTPILSRWYVHRLLGLFATVRSKSSMSSSVNKPLLFLTGQCHKGKWLLTSAPMTVWGSRSKIARSFVMKWCVNMLYLKYADTTVIASVSTPRLTLTIVTYWSANSVSSIICRLLSNTIIAAPARPSFRTCRLQFSKPNTLLLFISGSCIRTMSVLVLSQWSLSCNNTICCRLTLCCTIFIWLFISYCLLFRFACWARSLMFVSFVCLCGRPSDSEIRLRPRRPLTERHSRTVSFFRGFLPFRGIGLRSRVHDLTSPAKQMTPGAGTTDLTDPWLLRPEMPTSGSSDFSIIQLKIIQLIQICYQKKLVKYHSKYLL